MSDVSQTPPASPSVEEEEPVFNPFTPDAQERMNLLRAMADNFPDDEEPRPLTPSEVRLARHTSAAALEKAALFAEAAPGVGGSVADPNLYREAIAFEMAYGGLRDGAHALGYRVENAILRKKLKAVLAARGLYRIAKGYASVDAGATVRTHVEEMKRSLIRPRRKKSTGKEEVPEGNKSTK